MSYIKSVIVPGETLIVSAKTHWFIYVVPIALLVASIRATLAIPSISILVFPATLFLLCQALLYAYSTEMAVTNKRIIAKNGFIRRNTIELRIEKVESLKVDQSILGRIFNFGTVSITGSGGTTAPIPYISNPLAFRSAALTGLEPEQN
jgi:uncharacterized membrane protein YdbT with pleckstrin-like domain